MASLPVVSLNTEPIHKVADIQGLLKEKTSKVGEVKLSKFKKMYTLLMQKVSRSKQTEKEQTDLIRVVIYGCTMLQYKRSKRFVTPYISLYLSLQTI